MNVIYPVKDNSYITLVDEEFKSIRCNNDYSDVFSRDVVYSYRLYKHDETGINFYVVYKDVKSEPNIFTKDSLSKYFDITSIIREEKLNNLGI